MSRSRLEEILDISTWSEKRGFGSIKGPICPHCNTLQRPALCPKQGDSKVRVAVCETCGEEFQWTHTAGPLGWQWDTFVDVAPPCEEQRRRPNLNADG